MPHLQEAENSIVSFGQGCEGDPILQADVISEAVRKMRRQTDRGTINFNSNASLPDAIDKLVAAGSSRSVSRLIQLRNLFITPITGLVVIYLPMSLSRYAVPGQQVFTPC